jgi:hypothetical protein
VSEFKSERTATESTKGFLVPSFVEWITRRASAVGFSDATSLNSTPNPMVTCMAGFESLVLALSLMGKVFGVDVAFFVAGFEVAIVGRIWVATEA